MRKLCYCGALALALAVVAEAPAQRTASTDLDVQFKAAQQKEIVDGDLKGAINQYLAVVAHAGTNRALAAQALLRAAECYRKQGDAQARNTYERIVREYPDQKESVSLARERLGNDAPGASIHGMNEQRVWTGQQPQAVSADGRFLSYQDERTGNLVVRDLTTGTDRVVTGNPLSTTPVPEFKATQSAFSRDGRHVAYVWAATGRRTELRLADLRAPGVPSPRVLYQGAEDQDWFVPDDWSPDGRWIAITAGRKDQTSFLGLVSTADGSLTVLKSMGWGGPAKVSFSPDGRYIAFDHPVGDDANAQHDIAVLSADGHREVPAVVHPSDDVLLGWSPDGKRLLFASDRGESLGLWIIPFEEGATRGAPMLVKSNIEGRQSLAVTRNGVLYLGARRYHTDVQITPVDLATGKSTAEPSRPIQRYIGTNLAPEWSPDGKELAYISRRNLIPPVTMQSSMLGIWTRATGQIRDVRPQLSYLNLGPGLSWTSDAKSLLVVGRDAKGRGGVFTVDARTGATTAILRYANPSWLGFQPKLSPDGTNIYYRVPEEQDARKNVLIERELVSGREREVTRGSFGAFKISPDGRWIATVRNDAATGASSLELIPASEGDTRQLLSADLPQSIISGPLTWTRDSRNLLVVRAVSTQTPEFWLVPVDGGAPRKLDIAAPGGFASINASGDLATVVATDAASSARDEVWALENFLPTLKAKP